MVVKRDKICTRSLNLLMKLTLIKSWHEGLLLWCNRISCVLGALGQGFGPQPGIAQDLSPGLQVAKNEEKVLE